MEIVLLMQPRVSDIKQTYATINMLIHLPTGFYFIFVPLFNQIEPIEIRIYFIRVAWPRVGQRMLKCSDRVTEG